MSATGVSGELSNQQASGARLSNSIGRRRLLQGAAIGAGAAWVAPSVLSLDAAYAATVNCGVPVVTGAITVAALTAGDSLADSCNGGTWNSDTTMYLFLERSAVTGFTPFTSDSGATISPRVCSWILHHSPATGSTPQTKVGTVSFGANKIIGFDHCNTPVASNGCGTSLDDRDIIMGFPGVTYENPDATRRTMDVTELNDVLTASGASPFTTLSVTSVTTNCYTDQVRIYTTTTP